MADDSEVLPDTKNATWKNDKTRFGYKFLQKFGWSEEKGLGKNESGITESLQVKKKQDNEGLGMEKDSDGAGAKGWNQTTKGFNEVLDALKDEYSSKSKKDKKNKKDKKEKKEKTASSAPPLIKVGMKYVKSDLIFQYYISYSTMTL